MPTGKCRDDTNVTRKKIFESILESPELCILDDKTHTYLHQGNGTTAIDLTLCSPLIFMEFHWLVHDEECGSDHSLIFLKSKNSTPEETNPKWLIHKADWLKFKLCSTLIDEEILNKPDPMSAFTNILI